MLNTGARVWIWGRSSQRWTQSIRETLIPGPIRTGTATLEMGCNCDLEGCNFTVLQVPAYKIKYLQLSDKWCRNQLWGKCWCCCVWSQKLLDNHGVSLLGTHELKSSAQGDSQLLFFSWSFFKASADTTAVHLCCLSGAMCLKWYEV